MLLKATVRRADLLAVIKRLQLAVAIALAALAFPAIAAAGGLSIGVTDDLGKDAADGGVAFLDTLAELGMRENRVSVPWDPDAPATVRDKPQLDRYVANATARGVRVVFAVYPARPTALTSTLASTGQFTAFLQTLARSYPEVQDFIVGNEPNQPRFWRPQFDANRNPLACTAYAATLAAAYDALKSVDAGIRVIGVGLSPRGNDDPLSPDNPSTSPVRCLRDIGAAYRASGRTTPLMDELAFHAYPDRDTHPLAIGYPWPRAGLNNLDRIKQAVWDAFNGTAQPTFEEAGQSVVLTSLKLRLAEVGWQVGIVPSAQSAYHGQENVTPTDEGHQAEIYAEAIRLAACDASVKSLLFFGLQDEPDLARWQAGLMRADGTRRPSYDSVKAAIAQTGANCPGGPFAWRHAAGLVGASVRFGDARRVLPATQRRWGFAVGAKENALFTAGLFRIPRAPAAAPQWAKVVGRSLARGGALRPTLRVSGRVKAPWGRSVSFPLRRVAPGYYVYGIRLTAEMNRARATVLMSQAFRVGKIDRTSKPKTRKPRKKRAR
ncbi:MAG: hypothetical protein ICV59_05340 [Thermoleophilia bacterium]|nr:hypothetical protein [Thermoleophilia bacterium]